MKNCRKLITTKVVIVLTFVLLFGSAVVPAQFVRSTPKAWSIAVQIQLNSGGTSPTAALAGPQQFRGTVGVPMRATILASGGTPAYSWSVVSGQLPPQASASGSTFSLTPMQAGTWSSVLKVVDSSQPARSSTQSLTITIVDAPPVAITSTSLASGQSGAAYAANLQAQGGVPGYTWSLAGGSLPAGLAMSGAGIISGTPAASGTFNFIAQAADTTSPAHTATRALSLVVKSAPLAIVAGNLASAQAGTAYGAALQATGGTPAYTWSIKSGSLPAGLTLASTTGLISGKPSTTGTSSFTVAVADNSSPAQVQTATTSIVVAAAPVSTSGNTWYVRPDGGTRFSANMTTGQCDGKSDAAYHGTGVNQPCAFNDVRYLWQDKSYTYGSSFPSWGWIGKGGDTYLIRGSIADGVRYRVGYGKGDGTYDGFGIAGDPYGSGMPAPPSGTASQHTRLLGGNWQNCHTQGTRTQLFGGYAAGHVMSFSNTAYVDAQCFDVTDNSACGVSSNAYTCRPNPPMDDYAKEGISFANTTTHLFLQDIRIHGLAGGGIAGPTGDSVELHYVDVIGNAGSGWNADANDGTTGVGNLLVQNYNISWNGCLEEFPIVHALPYHDCTDQSSGGYGDGFGTATVTSGAPGWHVTFDQGEVAYNTQDGLDALHMRGNGSSMTVTRTLAYGNMGQQLKIGSELSTATNNILVGNCNAMSQDIPGTPAGYNSRLSAFCRGGDTNLVVSISHGSTSTVRHNTFITDSVIQSMVICNASAGNCDTTALLDYRDNIEVNNMNQGRQGYPSGLYLAVQDDTYTNPAACNAAPNHFWQTDGFNGCQIDPTASAGSLRDHNAVLNAREGCPAKNETNVVCGSPGLGSEIMPAYGFPDLRLAGTGSPAYHNGIALPGVPTDYAGNPYNSTPSIGALEYGSTIQRH